MNWRGCGRMYHGIINIFLEKSRKIMKNLSQDRSLGQDLNMGPPKYGAGLLTTEL
jgi:hypothetical protein